MKIKKTDPKPASLSQADALNLGIKQLKIDVPILRYEFRKDHIIFYLYGGSVVIFPIKRQGAA